MIVITQYTSATYTSQIRSTKEAGFKVLYRSSSTSGHVDAARAVVRRYFGEKAADSVERIPDTAIADYVPSSKRSNPVTLWSFKH